MRFLYGDSSPFPLGYDFLASLEVFMTAATRIVQLEHEALELTRQAEDLAAGRVKSLEALEQFHSVVMRAVQETAQKVQNVHALEYAQKVGQFASSFVEEHRRSSQSTNEREATQARADTNRRRLEQRQQLESFLKVGRLPILATRVSMNVVGEGKEARHQMSAVFENPDGIQTSFVLATAKVPAWNTPRRVGELVQGTELSVGIDKSWLRGTVTPKQVNVDDWLMTQFEVSEENFTLTLRRKLTEKESVHFELRRNELLVDGIVSHPGQSGADALAGPLGRQDVATLEGIWQALRLACRDVTEFKDQLVSVTLDGEPVLEVGLAVPLIVRLVTMFAPTVREIARRSPNEFELSLKQENDGGRREEIYLRKEQLVSRLQPLSAAGREIFAPLGLDSWVPGVTAPPPPVGPASQPPLVIPSSSQKLPQD